MNDIRNGNAQIGTDHPSDNTGDNARDYNFLVL